MTIKPVIDKSSGNDEGDKVNPFSVDFFDISIFSSRNFPDLLLSSYFRRMSGNAKLEYRRINVTKSKYIEDICEISRDRSTVEKCKMKFNNF